MTPALAVALYFFVGMTVSFRLTVMFVYENGPENVFGRFRYWLGIRYDEHSIRYGTTFLARLFMCHKCLSVWIGWGVAALLHPALFGWADIFWHGFVFSAATLVLQSLISNRRKDEDEP